MRKGIHIIRALLPELENNPRYGITHDVTIVHGFGDAETLAAFEPVQFMPSVGARARRQFFNEQVRRTICL